MANMYVDELKKRKTGNTGGSPVKSAPKRKMSRGRNYAASVEELLKKKKKRRDAGPGTASRYRQKKMAERAAAKARE